MAKHPTKRTVQDDIDREIARGEGDTLIPDTDEPKKREPTYAVMGNSKIAVSKSHGKLWQSRKDQAISKRKKNDTIKAWDEALRYFRNDQTSHRFDVDDEGEYAGNEAAAMHMQRRFSETENIVFANTTAMVPKLYAKNPIAEFTANDPADEQLSVVLNKLVNRLLGRKAQPGVNLKTKVRKSVVMATLANSAYIEVGYTFKEQSSEQAMEDLQKLSEQLVKAKSPQQIEEIEGKITALEQHVDVLRPAGPFARYRRPHDVIFDPDGNDDDHTDAKWGMVCDYVSTAYLNARYAERKGNKIVSRYKPTHVVSKDKASGQAGHDDIMNSINNYSLFGDDDKSGDAHDYGYKDEDSYRKAQRTKVWYVWDKTTMRVYLYADNDWSWPIWVWDDPYKLQGFFPIYRLQFITDPEHTECKGETTYYLDQQDSINTINSEMKQARQWARRNLFYDKNKVDKSDVEKMIKGDEDVAVGVDVPEGMTLKDMVQSIVPPSMQFVQLFDKTPILEAIDRVSSVMPVQRGVEFKTNTTNQAINEYNSVAQTRADEKIDAVEDFIGQIAWAIGQMCLQFMPAHEVATLIGHEASKEWRNMTAPEIATDVQMTIVGGSTQKQSSEAKKQQALQMGQVLGQFVDAAPQAVLMVLIDTLRAAFNDVIPDEKWTLIMEAVTGGGTADPNGAEGSDGARPTQQAANGAQSPDAGADPIAAISQLVDQLPPEAKQALGSALARGVPVQEALPRIIEMVQQPPAA